ncbi:MAG: N-acetylmuramoyl-L-alanine amidase [Waddliaceae bacterium]
MNRFLFFITALCITSCSPVSINPPYNVTLAPGSDPQEIVATPLMRLNKRPRVMIDAGHGGKDEGAKSPHIKDMIEKDLTLSTAKLLDRYLRQLGYETILTRSNDVFIPLDVRAEFANANSPDLFVSVHYNSAPNKSAQGIEVFYYKEESERSERAKVLAGAVLDTVLTSTQAKSRGTKHGNFAVIRDTKMPAILIEAGFLTNQEESKLIEDAYYRNRLARGIAQGIRNYVQNR